MLLLLTEHIYSRRYMHGATTTLAVMLHSRGLVICLLLLLLLWHVCYVEEHLLQRGRWESLSRVKNKHLWRVFEQLLRSVCKDQGVLLLWCEAAPATQVGLWTKLFIVGCLPCILMQGTWASVVVVGTNSTKGRNLLLGRRDMILVWANEIVFQTENRGGRR